jgi:hypothetical protein
VPGRCAGLALAIVLIGLGIGIGGCGRDPESGASPPTPTGDAPALGGVAISRGGHYRIDVRPADSPVTLGEMHDWVVHLERTDAAPARPSIVRFDGGMPSHGHGFVTAPRVTRDLGGGKFLVEGVKFHMAGAWEIRVTLTNAEGGDQVSIPITVTP